MTFTYDVGNPGDLEEVRFKINDTDESVMMFSDEAINWRLTKHASATNPVGLTLVDLIKNRMAQLASEPDMTADWLKIDWRRSAENWRSLLAEVRREFGLGATVASGGQHAWRPDLQKEAPVYYDTSSVPDDEDDD